MRLDENEKQFEQLIVNTSKHLKIVDVYVEKDYWLVLLLKSILSKNRGYVFKGGTSLSKCYHIINRFSEDIDISYSDSYDSISVTEKNRKFRGITTSIKEIGLEIINPDHLRRQAYFNRFKCPYLSLVKDSSIEKAIIIELASQTPSFPSIIKPIQSFIGEYLEKIGRHDLVELYELQPFNVVVQSLSRTIVDKTYAICDYYLDGKCEKHSRHIYDIFKILPNVSLDDSLCELFKEVRKHRLKISICSSAKEGVLLSNVLSSIIEENVFKADYETTTYRLLYEDVKYKDCVNSLKILLNFLNDYNL